MKVKRSRGDETSNWLSRTIVSCGNNSAPFFKETQSMAKKRIRNSSPKNQPQRNGTSRTRRRSIPPTPVQTGVGDDIPSPKEIVEHLDAIVIGQDEAKKRLAVGVTNHHKRLNDHDGFSDCSMDDLADVTIQRV